jgi:hypothetical protein
VNACVIYLMLFIGLVSCCVMTKKGEYSTIIYFIYFFLCLTYKQNFIIGMYRKKTLYVFGSVLSMVSDMKFPWGGVE